MPIINEDFASFPAEAAIIGRLLTGYSEIELSLCLCLSQTRVGLDCALKKMFGDRGETKRIDKAQTLGGPPYKGLKLHTTFASAIADMRYCLRIRNQYAHSQWLQLAGGRLGFVNLEEAARTPSPVLSMGKLKARHLDAGLLNLQEEFFIYVKKIFDHLNFQAQIAAGKSSIPPQTTPKKVVRPPLHIP
jgi:hypothetical protein